MKILHTVESYYPSTGGMQEVVRQLSERLVKLGHNVTVATKYDKERQSKVINGVKIEEFNLSGNTVRGIEGGKREILRYQKFVTDSKYDLVTLFAAQQWATDLLLEVLKNIKAKKVFVPTGFSGLYLKEYEQYFNKMKVWLKDFDTNVFLSSDYRDINFSRENGVEKEKIYLIPNGAAEDEFMVNNHVDIREKFNIEKNEKLIITVGSHTGAKGHWEAIRIFLRAKIGKATLIIIGNSFGGGCTKLCKFVDWLSKNSIYKNKRIIVPNLNRKETVSAYKEADLFLFPSNIECSPIVLFECMASKTPFLTSDVGNSKEIVEWSKAGIVLPTTISKSGFSKVRINESAKILAKLIVDKKSMKTYSNNGYKIWKKKFSWEKISKQYESLYKKLIN